MQEVAALQSYTGPKEELGTAERFLFELLCIPRLKPRLQVPRACAPARLRATPTSPAGFVWTGCARHKPRPSACGDFGYSHVCARECGRRLAHAEGAGWAGQGRARAGPGGTGRGGAGRASERGRDWFGGAGRGG